MSEISDDAIVCGLRAHGEHNAIVRIMTSGHGLLSGYVRGARARGQRALLIPGNRVRASWRARVDEQLGTLSMELLQSRAPLALGERLEASALAWVTALCMAAVPERVAYTNLYQALDGIISLLDVAKPRVWAQALVRFELVMLTDLGFGLDLASCAATGDCDELVYVSPRSAQAVSRAAGAPYHERLLPLPPFVQAPVEAGGWAEIADGLRLSGFFLERQFLIGPAARCLETRRQLVEQLAGMTD